MNKTNFLWGLVIVGVIAIVVAAFWPQKISYKQTPVPTPVQTIPITPDHEGKGA